MFGIFVTIIIQRNNYCKLWSSLDYFFIKFCYNNIDNNIIYVYIYYYYYNFLIKNMIGAKNNCNFD